MDHPLAGFFDQFLEEVAASFMIEDAFNSNIGCHFWVTGLDHLQRTLATEGTSHDGKWVAVHGQTNDVT